MALNAPRKTSTIKLPQQVCAVDLFCGVGGKTHGFIKAGLPVAAGYDIDASCQYAYEHNNPGTKFIRKGVEELSAQELSECYPANAIKVLIGCAPCQPFSTYSYRYGAASSAGSEDNRWALLYSFIDLIKKVRPTVVSAENVPQLARLKHQVYLDFIKELGVLGYHVSESIVKCADYGVPQTRERLVVLASLNGSITLIPPTHKPEQYVSVKEAIGHLPRIEAGSKQNKKDALHISSKLSAQNLVRIQATPEGGGWQDWPMDIRLECHKKPTGLTYPSVYPQTLGERAHLSHLLCVCRY